MRAGARVILSPDEATAVAPRMRAVDCVFGGAGRNRRRHLLGAGFEDKRRDVHG
jgi:hypothetical protein